MMKAQRQPTTSAMPGTARPPSRLAVPGIALVVGWRWAFIIGAIAAVGIAAWALLNSPGSRIQPDDGESQADRGTPRGGLLVLTIGAGLAAAAATSIGVFLVDSAVQSGMTPSTAGLLFAGSALLGLLIRIGLGAAMDRYPGRSPYVLIANLLIVGAVGYLLLGIGGTPFFTIGALLAYSAGWTWPGLVHFAVVRDNRLAAASATGILQTGLSLGATAPAASHAVRYDVASTSNPNRSGPPAATFRIGRRMIRHRTENQLNMKESQ